MLSRLTPLLLALALPAAPAWNRVSVPPMKTSIYVGSVTLTTGPLELRDDALAADYEARVFPWFFWSESGHLSIGIAAADRARLAAGETVEFTGTAQNRRNKPRTVTGRAQPAGPASGRIKVRIMADGIELIFNGTYQLSGS